jgi:hypothetical protein
MRYRPGAIAALLLAAGVAAADAQTAILQIQVIEGEGAVQAAGARSLRPLTVQITDETGRPVNGAAVSFRLPDGGPTGTFANGLKTLVVLTGADGRATDWSVQWGREAGPARIRVTAAKDQARAGAMVNLYVSATVVPPVKSAPDRPKTAPPPVAVPHPSASEVKPASIAPSASGIRIFETPKSQRPAISRGWWVGLGFGAAAAVLLVYRDHRSVAASGANTNPGGGLPGASTTPTAGGIRFGQPIVTIGRP